MASGGKSGGIYIWEVDAWMRREERMDGLWEKTKYGRTASLGGYTQHTDGYERETKYRCTTPRGGDIHHRRILGERI